MDQTILQVSDLLALINQTLDYAYPSVVVEGEVSQFKVSKAKYVFFDLKDESGVVSCFMMVYGLRQPLEDGMRVQVVAQPRLTAWGKFSLTVREVRPVGEGSIKRAFDLLRTKLAAEGLFDAARKRTLPWIPQRVGLIASVESAGYADFVKILNQRWSGVAVEVADVQVQGQASAEQIIRAIDHFNGTAEPPDVLVLVRGGGSADDLAVFNDELVVRAVATSRVPTLVGVGHEVDVTLCDLAADVRAATPSNAAQLLVPDRQALAAELTQRQKRLAQLFASRISAVRRTLETATQQMINRLDQMLAQQRRQIEQAQLLLKQLDPRVVLQRGYSVVRGARGQLIRGVHDVKLGETLEITSAHAIIRAGVIDATQT